MFRQIRNSQLDLHQVYFWTNTIKSWHSLLAEDRYKQIILDSWRYLVTKKKIKVYAFVIMPNHLHVIWELLNLNGKEMPHASFNKFTAHQFLNHYNKSNRYTVSDIDRKHRFWQRDPLAILMDSKQKVEQKLDYIHLNPLQEKWNLAEYPEDYTWSSAGFYETGHDQFGLITDYRDRF